MNIERLRQIIEYSDANRDDMESKVKNFYSFVGMSSDKEVLNIMQIARPVRWILYLGKRQSIIKGKIFDVRSQEISISSDELADLIIQPNGINIIF